jgi:serine/threonine-protein kinase
MAELYLARTDGMLGFQKLVALKRILPELSCDEDFARMFCEEARLAATLQHPNIAQVFDIGQDGAHYFFTMEYVRGADLRGIFKAAQRHGLPLPLEAALTIATGVCAGLHHAHEKIDGKGRPLEIVHRDVSPANVLVTYDGCVKIVDFGIAKASVRHDHTPAGKIKGKLAYMSPEQCQGQPIDRRSDVFAVGILLFELTTGTPLFRADTDWGIFKKIVFEDVPRPSWRSARYPKALEAIVMKALANKPQERYATAQELQCALEELAREQRIPISNVVLSRFMQRLFPKARDRTWVEARPIARVVSSARTPSEPPAGQAVPATATARRPRPPRTTLLAVAVVLAFLAVASTVGFTGVDDITVRPVKASKMPAPPPDVLVTHAPEPAPALAPAQRKHKPRTEHKKKKARDPEREKAKSKKAKAGTKHTLEERGPRIVTEWDLDSPLLPPARR